MKVLILTPQAEGKTLKESFALSGFEVQVEESALYALTLLERNRPDIIVSSEHLPEMSGAEFYELVRADRSLTMVPFLLIGGDPAQQSPVESHQPPAEPAQARPLGLGDLDRALPAHTPIPEVVRAAYRLVLELTRKTIEMASENASSKGGIQGKLGEISLFELGQWLSRSAKSGRLSVQMGLEEGTWLFSKGQLIHAEYGGRSGEDAVLSLLIQAEGKRHNPGEGSGGYFVFEPLGEADFFLEPVTIRKTTDQLLLSLAVEMDHQQGDTHRA